MRVSGRPCTAPGPDHPMGDPPEHPVDAHAQLPRLRLLRSGRHVVRVELQSPEGSKIH